MKWDKQEIATIAIIITIAITIRIYANTLPNTTTPEFYKDNQQTTYLIENDGYFFLKQIRDNTPTTPLTWTITTIKEATKTTDLKAHQITQTIIFILTTIIIYITTRKIGQKRGATIATLFYITNPIILSKTLIASGDRDNFILLLTTITIYLIIKAGETIRRRDIQKTITYTTILIAVLIIYTLEWRGSIIIITITGIYTIIKLLQHNTKATKAIAIIITTITTIAIINKWTLIQAYANFGNTAMELHNLTPAILITQIGTTATILITITTINTLIDAEKHKTILRTYILSTTTLALTMIRFLPLSIIGSTIAISNTTNHAISKTKQQKTMYIIILTIIIITTLHNTQQNSPINYLPTLNDQWINTAQQINENTPTNTEIISNWDTGHIWHYLTNKTTTLSGGDHNNPKTRQIKEALQNTNKTQRNRQLKQLTNEEHVILITNEQNPYSTGYEVIE